VSAEAASEQASAATLAAVAAEAMPRSQQQRVSDRIIRAGTCARNLSRSVGGGCPEHATPGRPPKSWDTLPPMHGHLRAHWQATAQAAKAAAERLQVRSDAPRVDGPRHHGHHCGSRPMRYYCHVQCPRGHQMRREMTGKKHKPHCIGCDAKIPAMRQYFRCECSAVCSTCRRKLL
jgi:hypothetical protein